MKIRNFLLTPLFLMALYGCNARDAGNLTQDARRLAGDSAQALGSATLAAKVNTVLSLRKGIDMSGFRVETQDGVVTLGGRVRSAVEKKLVRDTVDGIRGVDKVVDNLRVESSGSAR